MTALTDTNIPAHSPKYADFEQTLINLTITHPAHGEIPFTASADDCEALGRSLHARALAGDFGDIAPYDGAPPPDPQEVAEQQARAQRDQKLAALDNIVSNPLRWAGYTDEQKTEFATYRQALLDVPQQEGFPAKVEWPVMPVLTNS